MQKFIRLLLDFQSVRTETCIGGAKSPISIVSVWSMSEFVIKDTNDKVSPLKVQPSTVGAFCSHTMPDLVVDDSLDIICSLNRGTEGSISQFRESLRGYLKQ